MVDAEIASAIANGTLAAKLGDFKKVHRQSEPFVWDDEMDALMRS